MNALLSQSPTWFAGFIVAASIVVLAVIALITSTVTAMWQRFRQPKEGHDERRQR